MLYGMHLLRNDLCLERRCHIHCVIHVRVRALARFNRSLHVHSLDRIISKINTRASMLNDFAADRRVVYVFIYIECTLNLIICSMFGMFLHSNRQRFTSM